MRRPVENQKEETVDRKWKVKKEKKGKIKERGDKRRFSGAHKCWFS